MLDSRNLHNSQPKIVVGFLCLFVWLALQLFTINGVFPPFSFTFYFSFSLSSIVFFLRAIFSIGNRKPAVHRLIPIAGKKTWKNIARQVNMTTKKSLFQSLEKLEKNTHILVDIVKERRKTNKCTVILWCSSKIVGLMSFSIQLFSSLYCVLRFI